MGWRGTLVATLLLLIAAGLYFFIEEQAGSEQSSGAAAGQPEQRTTPLADFQPGAVARLELARDGEVRATRRDGGKWLGVERSDQVTDFLAALTKLGALGQIDSTAEELEQYGLAPARGKLTAYLENGTPRVIELGRHNPNGTAVYIRFPATGRVVLAGALVDWEFQKVFRSLPPSQPVPTPVP